MVHWKLCITFLTPYKSLPGTTGLKHSVQGVYHIVVNARTTQLHSLLINTSKLKFPSLVRLVQPAPSRNFAHLQLFTSLARSISFRDIDLLGDDSRCDDWLSYILLAIPPLEANYQTTLVSSIIHARNLRITVVFRGLQTTAGEVLIQLMLTFPNHGSY